MKRFIGPQSADSEEDGIPTLELPPRMKATQRLGARKRFASAQDGAWPALHERVNRSSAWRTSRGPLLPVASIFA